MHRALGSFVAAAVLICTGCPLFQREPGPSEAEYCSFEEPGDTSSLPERVVELGDVAGDEFRPFEDGDEVEIVTGFQGQAMYTPYIELPAQDSDRDEECWWLQIDYYSDDYETTGWQYGVVFERVGDVMRAGPLFEQPDGFFGGIANVRVTVVGEDFVAVDEVVLAIPDS